MTPQRRTPESLSEAIRLCPLSTGNRYPGSAPRAPTAAQGDLRAAPTANLLQTQAALSGRVEGQCLIMGNHY